MQGDFKCYDIIMWLYAIPVALTLIFASLGESFIAKWIGYEFALYIGCTIWVLLAIYTGERFWLECALLSQILCILIPICIYLSFKK